MNRADGKVSISWVPQQCHASSGKATYMIRMLISWQSYDTRLLLMPTSLTGIGGAIALFPLAVHTQPRNSRQSMLEASAGINYGHGQSIGESHPSIGTRYSEDSKKSDSPID